MTCPFSSHIRMLKGVPARKELLQVEGREIAISNPEKIFFPQRGYSLCY